MKIGAFEHFYERLRIREKLSVLNYCNFTEKILYNNPIYPRFKVGNLRFDSLMSIFKHVLTSSSEGAFVYENCRNSNVSENDLKRFLSRLKIKVTILKIKVSSSQQFSKTHMIFPVILIRNISIKMAKC